MSLQRVFVTR